MDAGAAGRDPALLGGRDALERFTAAAYPDVWRLCALLTDTASADDLAQETFLRAARALARFRGQASAHTWILAIARRTCMDELRARYRRARRDTLLESVALRDEAVPDHAGEVATNDVLRRLEPERRAAFVLTQLFRLSYAQAAAICECPTGTIRSRVARAREDLVELAGAHSTLARTDPGRRSS